MFVTFFKMATTSAVFHTDGSLLMSCDCWKMVFSIGAMRSAWSLRMHTGTVSGPMAFFGFSLWSSLKMAWLVTELLCIRRYGHLPRSKTVDMSFFLKIPEYYSLRIVAFPLGVVFSLFFFFLECNGGIPTWSLFLVFGPEELLVGVSQSSSNRESMYLSHDALMSCLRAS